MMDPEAEFELELQSRGQWTDGDDQELLLDDAGHGGASAEESSSAAQLRDNHAITSKFGILKLQAWWLGTQFLWLLLSVVVMPSQVHHRPACPLFPTLVNVLLHMAHSAAGSWQMPLSLLLAFVAHASLMHHLCGFDRFADARHIHATAVHNIPGTLSHPTHWQVRSLVGEEHKGKATGLITASGAVFSLFGSPLMGLIRCAGQ